MGDILCVFVLLRRWLAARLTAQASGGRLGEGKT